MLFSQRYGYKPVNDIIQSESVNEELRARLWNVFQQCYLQERQFGFISREYDNLLVSILGNFFKLPVDNTLSSNSYYRALKNQYSQCNWYEVYDFIEFVVRNLGDEYGSGSKTNQNFREMCNQILEDENSAYRFVGDHVTKIISEIEIEAVEQATSQGKYDVVSMHLDQALTLLADKKEPDYRNSIKESISAIESLCKIIIGENKATLGQALKKIEEKYQLHPALREAFSKMYGYTSDKDGIRHALLETGDNPCYEDALYMLITCSAFTNYLIEKSR